MFKSCYSGIRKLLRSHFFTEEHAEVISGKFVLPILHKQPYQLNKMPQKLYVSIITHNDRFNDTMKYVL